MDTEEKATVTEEKATSLTALVEETPEEKAKAKKTFTKVLIGAFGLILLLGCALYITDYVVSDVTLQVDGKTASGKTDARTVGEFMDEHNLEVADGSKIEPGRDAQLEDGMTIEVERKIVKEEVQKEDTPFETIRRADNSMAEGKSKVTRKGRKGKDKVTYEVTYLGGKEIGRKEIKRKTVRKPVAKIVNYGTMVEFNGALYSRKLVVQATAYTGGGTTATGTPARVGEIAVDPRVIPLGSICYIEGFGQVRAEDTGGAVKGNIIDIYMATYGECVRWGRRTVTIYIQ